MLDLPAILKQAEAGISAMESCPSTTEDLHLTAEGYAYIGNLRANAILLVAALEEARALLQRWCCAEGGAKQEQLFEETVVALGESG